MFEVPVTKPDFADSPCNGCTSACCRAGVTLQLTRREARQMVRAGGELKKLPRSEWPAERIPLAGAMYTFMEDCVNLDAETGECANYEERPYACRAFTAENAVCETMRERFQQTVELGMPKFREGA